MVSICGFSAYNLSLFHLMNHAIFKAALFLCAGSIIHALSNEQDMRKMGALIKFLPITYIVMFIASLAITGFPFLTGFYSKDFIFEVVFNSFGSANIFIYWIISITAFFTAFYSFRLVFFIFLNKPNLSRLYILNIHESSYAISITLIILGFGSLFSGFLFKDLFLGFGNLFLILNINPLLAPLNFFDSEFLLTSIKLFPLFMGFLGFFLLFVFIFLLKNYLIFYIKYTNWVFYFFINKWYFDFIYNFYINLNCFKFAKIGIYKNIDKGFLEFFGPLGFWLILKKIYFLILKTQTGLIYFYLFIYGFFIFFFLYLFKIEVFFSFFSFFLITFLKQKIFSLQFWFLKQRFLFKLVKKQTIREYLEAMSFFYSSPDTFYDAYWKLIESVDYDDAYVQYADYWKYFEWLLWSSQTTYDLLWLKSLLNFGQIYWPKFTVLIFSFLIAFSFFICGYCFILVHNSIGLNVYMIVWFFVENLECFFFYTSEDSAYLFIFYFFIVFIYLFFFLNFFLWNNIYLKIFYFLRFKSNFLFFKQDMYLLFVNFIFFSFSFILCLTCISLTWTLLFYVPEEVIETRNVYDPLFDTYFTWTQADFWKYYEVPTLSLFFLDKVYIVQSLDEWLETFGNVEEYRASFSTDFDFEDFWWILNYEFWLNGFRMVFWNGDNFLEFCITMYSTFKTLDPVYFFLSLPEIAVLMDNVAFCDVCWDNNWTLLFNTFLNDIPLWNEIYETSLCNDWNLHLRLYEHKFLLICTYAVSLLFIIPFMILRTGANIFLFNDLFFFFFCSLIHIWYRGIYPYGYDEEDIFAYLPNNYRTRQGANLLNWFEDNFYNLFLCYLFFRCFFKIFPRISFFIVFIFVSFSCYLKYTNTTIYDFYENDPYDYAKIKPNYRDGILYNLFYEYLPVFEEYKELLIIHLFFNYYLILNYITYFLNFLFLNIKKNLFSFFFFFQKPWLFFCFKIDFFLLQFLIYRKIKVFFLIFLHYSKKIGYTIIFFLMYLIVKFSEIVARFLSFIFLSVFSLIKKRIYSIYDTFLFFEKNDWVYDDDSWYINSI